MDFLSFHNRRVYRHGSYRSLNRNDGKTFSTPTFPTVINEPVLRLLCPGPGLPDPPTSLGGSLIPPTTWVSLSPLTDPQRTGGGSVSGSKVTPKYLHMSSQVRGRRGPGTERGVSEVWVVPETWWVSVVVVTVGLPTPKRGPSPRRLGPGDPSGTSDGRKCQVRMRGLRGWLVPMWSLT